MYMCASMCICEYVQHVYMCVDSHRVQKRVLNYLELKLHSVVSHPACVLGMKHGSLARAASS